MKLQRFRVTNFRSVQDSGWIETGDITALIGENESGKTNLLVPLWKLNPANGEPINLLADAPRYRYNEIREMPSKPVFIEADFEPSDDLVKQLVALTGATGDEVSTARVSRTLDGTYMVGFPKARPVRMLPKAELATLLQSAHDDIVALETKTAAEISFKAGVVSALTAACQKLDGSNEEADNQTLQIVSAELIIDADSGPKRSQITPRYGELTDALALLKERITKPHPQEVKEARTLVRNNLPSFVYYSDYGNLDSEIYLPHVIRNMQRSDLGVKEQAKARTLKVLFDFVRLKPQEILELGQEPDKSQGEPSAAQIEESAQRTKEREILLQSASTDLTGKFRSWWKQGDYRFRFQADGNHFRIWVSDDRRPEEVELEGRSRGLQWFFSFYLVFLVESLQSHKGAILLLDEPGLSLHPVAQEDLSRFFENLTTTNQLLYTTHSPFLVDPNHLDRVKVVYVDEAGKTAVSANLRENERAAGRSIYPVHAALGLTVSYTYLQGCTPILIEGQSDQIYLSAIKIMLISEGLLKPKRELVFVPVGGAKGVSPVIAILVGRDEALPYVLLDSDKVGQEMAKHLKDHLYHNDKERVVLVDAVSGRSGDEIEDLFPPDMLARIIAKQLPRALEDFDDVVDTTKSLVPQVKEFAKKHNIMLEEGWKVDIAKIAKERLLQGRAVIDQGRLTKWQELFLRISPD
jgi:energy-coupling factor transporter ATP-binding protein EcfA2